MSSWYIHTTADASKISLIIPMHYMLLLITLPALLAIVTLNIKREHP
jgi:hypothetical protein